MADTYKEYLATKVLAEGKPVTYRLLSRALKVNVNTAKQMLYDFHSKQNAKKPNSVHATYLFVGKQVRQPTENTNGAHAQDGEDSIMASSPFMSSMPEPEEPIPVTAVVMVGEEKLEKKKSEFAEITSIHIHSLEPGPIENMNMLSVCNQEIAKSYSEEDPLQGWSKYGSIHNPHIQRRTAKYAPAQPAKPQPTKAPAAAAKSAPRQSTSSIKKEEEEAATASRRGSISSDTKSGRSTPAPSSKPNTSKKPDPNKKKNVSELFKSFAKTKPPKAKEEKSKESTPAQTEDEPIMSEDSADEAGPELAFDAEKAATARKKRAETEAKLKNLFPEDEDETMEDAPPTEEPDSQDAPLDKEPAKPVDSQEAVTSQGGRRRGRRRVMKKKTVQDEDGYLVTKEEAVWESFSESEPEVKKKPVPKPSTAKGKRGGSGKYGQGSIASFFKKA